MTTDIEPTPSGYKLSEKPIACAAEEERVRDQLMANGVPADIAHAVVGHRLADVPFIYAGVPHEVLHHRVRANWTEGYDLLPGESALWIGTSDAIHNLVSENGWTDQIPEVIAQWRGSRLVGVKDFEVERLEVHRLPDGRHVEVTYRDVSRMGAFDGHIVRMALHVPEETFRPYGGRPRQAYRIYDFRNHPDTGWTLNPTSNTSGTTILNGFSEMLSFHMARITPVKADFASAYRYTQLPGSGAETIAIEAALAQRTEVAAATQERIADITGDTLELAAVVAPQAIEALRAGQGTHELTSMMIDGVLNHPGKFRILDIPLSEYTREQRFAMAQHIAKIIGEGHLAVWASTLQDAEGIAQVNAVTERFTTDFLAWLDRTQSQKTDLSAWIQRARTAADIANEMNVRSATVTISDRHSPGAIKGRNPAHSPEYVRVFDGMMLACLEQMIVFAGEQWLRTQGQSPKAVTDK